MPAPVNRPTLTNRFTIIDAPGRIAPSYLDRDWNRTFLRVQKIGLAVIITGWVILLVIIGFVARVIVLMLQKQGLL